MTLVGSFLVGLLCAAPQSANSAQHYLSQFEKAWAEVNTLEYILEKTERLRDGEVRQEAALVRFSKPNRFYIAATKPRKGQEVLYDSKVRLDELLVHPGRFPDFTLWIDIYGSLATGGQHHPVTHGAYGYIYEQLQFVRTQIANGKAKGIIRYDGVINVQGRKGHRVVVEVSPRKPRLIKARDEEPLFAFAKRVGVDTYRVFMENESIDELSDELEPGALYVVPSHYGTRMELVFDDLSGLLIRQRVWEPTDVLYEEYSFVSLKVNPVFGKDVFDPDNPAYNF